MVEEIDDDIEATGYIEVCFELLRICFNFLPLAETILVFCLDFTYNLLFLCKHKKSFEIFKFVIACVQNLII